MKIKNLRAGWVVIPDTGLKLKAGQVVEVEKLSPQTQMFIDKGYVARVDPPAQKEAVATKRESPAQPAASDYTKDLAVYDELNAKEAAEFIRKSTDLGLLRSIHAKETRKTVTDDLDARIKELSNF